MATLKHHNSFPHSNVFTHAVLDNDSAHLSGVLAWDAENQKIYTGTAAEETRRCMTQITTLLSELGLTVDNLVRVNLYITHLEDLAEINKVYATFFPKGVYPARTCVIVAALIGGARIEIECTAKLLKSSL
ncbi:hypothetical protein HDU97_000421 [Phlyctochytrium planicorne]|nr:hypothetical protein HDU97_000421 [Phlyctochytrium planicorne]